MAIIGEGISHRGFVHEDFNIPFYVSGTIAQADIAQPVSIDTGANHTVKMAADDDVIVGVLATYEDRVVEGVKVGTVAMKGGFQFAAVSGHTITVGGSIVSAGGNEVKQAAAFDGRTLVTKVDGDVVEVLFM